MLHLFVRLLTLFIHSSSWLFIFTFSVRPSGRVALRASALTVLSGKKKKAERGGKVRRKASEDREQERRSPRRGVQPTALVLRRPGKKCANQPVGNHHFFLHIVYRQIEKTTNWLFRSRIFQFALWVIAITISES